MSSHVIMVIGQVCKFVAAFFAMWAAWLAAKDHLLGKEKQQYERDKYARLWGALQKEKWHNLAGRLLYEIADMRTKMRNKVIFSKGLLLNKLPMLLFILANLLSLLLLFSTSMYNHFGLPTAVDVENFLGITVISHDLFLPALIGSILATLIYYAKGRIASVVKLCLLIIYVIVALESDMPRLYHEILSDATISMTLGESIWLYLTYYCQLYLIPVIILTYYLSLILKYAFPKRAAISVENVVDSAILLSLLSACITAIALIIGHVAAPYSPTLVNARAFVVNLICDSLTIYLTSKVVGVTTKTDNWKQVVSVVIWSLIIASTLSILTLVFGYAHPTLENGLPAYRTFSLSEAINIFFGRVSYGSFWDIGFPFWYAHSTFLPFMLVVLLLILIVICKSFIHLASSMTEEAKSLDKPLGFTYRFLAFIGLFFGLVSYLLLQK